jgi:hypothetical protein
MTDDDKPAISLAVERKARERDFTVERDLLIKELLEIGQSPERAAAIAQDMLYYDWLCLQAVTILGRLGPGAKRRSRRRACQDHGEVGSMKHERWNSRAIIWPCKDCGCDVAPVRNGKRRTWSVSDKAWKQAGMKTQGKRPLGTGEFLCWECFVRRFESRMGRPLEHEDCLPGYGTQRWVSKKEWRGWLRRHRQRRAIQPK